MSNKSNKKLIIILEGILSISALIFISFFNLNLSVALGIIIIAILIPLFIIFPYYSLLLLLIVRNSTDLYAENVFIDFYFVSLNFSSILGIMIILWAIYVILKENIDIKKIPLSIPWILFLFCASLSLIYSIDRASTLKNLTKLFNFYFIYIIFYHYFQNAQNKHKTRKYFILSILFSFFIPLIFGLYQFIFNKGYVGPEGLNRVYGTFTHPNIFSFTLLFLLFILVILYTQNYYKKRKKENKLILWLIFITIFTLINTFTRSAWLGALAFIFLWMFLYKKNKIFSVLYCVSIIAFTLFLVINYTPLKYYDFNNIDFVRRLTTSDTSISSTQWRMLSWRQMSSYVYKSPIIGFGLGTYRLLREKQIYSSVYEYPYYAHNDYYQTLIELGVIGLFFYCNLLLQTFRNIYKKYLQKKDKTILLSLFGIIIIFSIGFVDNILTSTSLQWLIWAYIAFLLT
ncbi:MAG TPA: O-antigen ligase family protein [bacterium]|jgi:O-antigen ligase|nr:O-antigen ligase family protein [bacterium]HOG38447.1 O-antigen ligase family protein [bacterium]